MNSNEEKLIKTKKGVALEMHNSFVNAQLNINSLKGVPFSNGIRPKLEKIEIDFDSIFKEEQTKFFNLKEIKMEDDQKVKRKRIIKKKRKFDRVSEVEVLPVSMEVAKISFDEFSKRYIGSEYNFTKDDMGILYTKGYMGLSNANCAKFINKNISDTIKLISRLEDEIRNIDYERKSEILKVTGSSRNDVYLSKAKLTGKILKAIEKKTDNPEEFEGKDLEKLVKMLNQIAPSIEINRDIQVFKEENKFLNLGENSYRDES